MKNKLTEEQLIEEFMNDWGMVLGGAVDNMRAYLKNLLIKPLREIIREEVVKEIVGHADEHKNDAFRDEDSPVYHDAFTDGYDRCCREIKKQLLPTNPK